MGVNAARKLSLLSEAKKVSLVIWPPPQRKYSAIERLKIIYRYHGYIRVILFGTKRLVQELGNIFGRKTWEKADIIHEQDNLIDFYRTDDFHSAECLDLVKKLNPDLGVVYRSYILKEELFTIPRLGTINLHLGKAPFYRGNSPGFWELMNAETEVGVTVHRVVEKLDAGPILLQKTFPIDTSPPGNCLKYLSDFEREVLHSNGLDMLCEVVKMIAAGTEKETLQASLKIAPYRSPNFKEKQALKRRIKKRRRRGKGLFDTESRSLRSAIRGGNRQV